MATRKVPQTVKSAWLVMREGGMPVKDIAELFCVSRETVRDTLKNAPDDEVRGIRRVLAMELVSRQFQLARKAMDELLERDFHERDPRGKHRIDAVQLSMIASYAIQNTEKMLPLAGMSDPEQGGPTNAVSELLMHQQQLAEAAKLLPKGTEVNLRQELSLRSDSTQGAVQAEWEDQANGDGSEAT